MATLLVWAKDTTLEGLIYPAGSVVPAGALNLTRLRSLRESNRILEVREEDVKPVSPHRPNTMDPRLIQEAEARVEQKKNELKIAKDYLASLEAEQEELLRPIEESEPERRGIEVDLEDVAKPKEKPTVEANTGSKVQEPTDIEEPKQDEPKTEEKSEDDDEDPFGDELLKPKATRGRKKRVEDEAKIADLEIEGESLPDHLNDNAV